MEDFESRLSNRPAIPRQVTRHCFQGKGDVAVFTSGGDSQGMNAAIRSVVRMGLYVGCRVYFIKEGYSGMVDGSDDMICEATWWMVSDKMGRGGTIIGSARCAEFRERDGRKKACLNLARRNITNLVCIGGDGSLTGARIFREEWPTFIKELTEEKQLTVEQAQMCGNLNVVGMVGSIDNDFCGTDMTIGTDSALHRIIEAADAITVTASSHQRAFVMEVMGRNCGYLALVAGLCTEADYVFIPEHPPKDGWQDKLCQKLEGTRKSGQRLNIIIVAEGAKDRKGQPITANMIRDLLDERLKLDARVTVLGHVQRGGNPSAFDRLLGTRQGAEAVIALLEATPTTPPVVIGIRGNWIVKIPMMEAVDQTRAVKAAMDSGEYDKAVAIRGASFANNFETFKILAELDHTSAVETDDKNPKVDAVHRWPAKHPQRLLVVHCGAPSCGMNAITRAFVRYSARQGYEVVAACNSWKGLAAGNTTLLHWTDVTLWSLEGGSKIGTKRTTPSEVGIDRVANALSDYQVGGILIVGGFEAFVSSLELMNAREQYSEFRIPIIVVPATISNNVPGTTFSIGADSSLNVIVHAIDELKQSALGTGRRAFIAETMGGYCGYLTTVAALSAGADSAYIPEEKFGIKELMNDFDHLKKKMEAKVQRGIVLRNEHAHPQYTTDFIHQLYTSEAGKTFDCRKQVLGYIQQGSRPSPFDRNLGIKFGCKAAIKLTEMVKKHEQEDGSVVCESPESVIVIGLDEHHTSFTPVQMLERETDMEHRTWSKSWFMRLRPLLSILANKDATYNVEAH